MPNPKDAGGAFDSSSHEPFYEYYKNESQKAETVERFARIRDVLLRVLDSTGRGARRLDVVDIGCGAGTQSMMWSQLGHDVHGIDINEPLIRLARERASQVGLPVQFQIGSATRLPWRDQSMDVCLVPELLEHVAEWESCLDEFTRILRPGGVLFLTTTNKLCPKQMEFDLPMYSWYPAPLKRYFERLAVTTRPELVTYTKYPAVNWFSFYSLRSALNRRGFRCMDRFDIMIVENKHAAVKFINSLVRHNDLLRWFAHVATPYTVVVAVKNEGQSRR